MKKREIYKIIISEDAKKRIKEGKCPSCGKPESEWNRRTDWRCCSVKCTEKFEKSKIIRSWPELRMKAFKRDNFTCAWCSNPPVKIHKNIYMSNKEFKEYFKRWHENIFVCFFKKKIKGKERLQAIVYDDSQLIGDHIKPISLGGDEWDLKNIQTLCIHCNKSKTRSDQINIAVARNIEKIQANGQKQL